MAKAKKSPMSSGSMKKMNYGGMSKMKSGGSKFPDLTGDGKVTRADILKGRGVIKYGGARKAQMGGMMDSYKKQPPMPPMSDKTPPSKTPPTPEKKNFVQKVIDSARANRAQNLRAKADVINARANKIRARKGIPNESGSKSESFPKPIRPAYPLSNYKKGGAMKSKKK